MKTSPTPGSCRDLIHSHLRWNPNDTLTGVHRAVKPLTLATVKSTLSKSPDFVCALSGGKWRWSLRPSVATTPAKPSHKPRKAKAR